MNKRSPMCMYDRQDVMGCDKTTNTREMFDVLYCHDFRRIWCLSLFGRCSAVVVTGFLAATDFLFLFFFHLLCLECTHLVPIKLLLFPYLTLWFPLCFVRDYSWFVLVVCVRVVIPAWIILADLFFRIKYVILLCTLSCA